MTSRPRTHVLALATGAVALVVAVAGCSPILAPSGGSGVVTVRPTAEPSVPSSPDDPSTTPAPGTTAPSVVGETADCGGARVSVSTGRDLTLTGDCPVVDVSGADIELDLTRATVGALTISGDRNEVDAGDLATARIAGQSNELSAVSIGVLEINGDRNDVDAEAEIASVTVSGNDNEIDANGIAAIVDNGTGNKIDGTG